MDRKQTYIKLSNALAQVGLDAQSAAAKMREQSKAHVDGELSRGDYVKACADYAQTLKSLEGRARELRRQQRTLGAGRNLNRKKRRS